MAPKLYMIPPSPPVRAVLLCAKVLGLDLELVPVNLFEGEHLKEEYLKKNPQHTVPLLEDDDGFLVVDSHAIMAYLVSKYGKDDKLYPKNDVKAKAAIDHILHFDSSTLFIRGLYCAKPLIYSNIQPTEEKLAALKDAFQVLDKILENKKTKYVAGDQLSIADFSVITTVTSWDIFVPYAQFPNLKAYVEKIQAHDWYELNKEGLTMLRGVIQSKLKA